MSTTLHDALAARIDQVGPAHPNLDELVGLGERRLRRRRLATVLGAAAAVILVLAAIAGVTGSHLAGRGNGPVDHPPTPVPIPAAPTRPIVYSDVGLHPADAGSLLGDPIHVGGRVVDTGSGWIHMDVTDDGVVYATGGYLDDGRVWFTDGGTPTQIGSHACVEAHGWPNTVVTGNSGSLAAWFDCTPGQDPALVVYDTGTGREVVRRPVPRCSKAQTIRNLGREVRVGSCLPDTIIGDHIYVCCAHPDEAAGLLEFDMATGRVNRVKPVKRVIPYTEDQLTQSYFDDIRSQPRSLVIGDSWATGTPQFGVGFAVVGKRLVPSARPGHPSVFDNATRRPVHLHLPPGYPADHEPGGIDDFGMFEWLDDDTVALIGSSGRQAGDILTCHLASGRCKLAVPSRGHERVIPGQGLF